MEAINHQKCTTEHHGNVYYAHPTETRMVLAPEYVYCLRSKSVLLKQASPKPAGPQNRAARRASR
jgi:hypothetical protein